MAASGTVKWKKIALFDLLALFLRLEQFRRYNPRTVPRDDLARNNTTRVKLHQIRPTHSAGYWFPKLLLLPTNREFMDRNERLYLDNISREYLERFQ